MSDHHCTYLSQYPLARHNYMEENASFWVEEGDPSSIPDSEESYFRKFSSTVCHCHCQSTQLQCTPYFWVRVSQLAGHMVTHWLHHWSPPDSLVTAASLRASRGRGPRWRPWRTRGGWPPTWPLPPAGTWACRTLRRSYHQLISCQLSYHYHPLIIYYLVSLSTTMLRNSASTSCPSK